MKGKPKPIKLSAGGTIPSGDPSVGTQPVLPNETLEDFKIPREEIEGSTRMRLEISSMSERVRAELESD